jgi:hypothetical protein
MADDGCQMADDEGQMANEECQMAEAELQVAGGEPGENEVASDEWRVASEVGVAVNPESAIQNPKSSREPTQERCLATEKAQNKANLESEQSPESQELKSESAEGDGPEQSQFDITDKIERVFILIKRS